MDKGLPSFGFATQPYSTSQDSFELGTGSKTTQSSHDFTIPAGFPNDFVSASKGGIFSGLVKYNDEFTLTLDTHFVYKKWVEDYVATEVGTLESTLSDSYIKGLFGASAAPLTYNAGIFTLDTDLSKYNNSVSAFLTEETDPIFNSWKTTIWDTWNFNYETLNNKPSIPIRLEHLDVDYTELGDGKILVYELSSLSWKPADYVPIGQLDIDKLNAAYGWYLTHGGKTTNWDAAYTWVDENGDSIPSVLGDLTDVITTGQGNGTIILHNGTAWEAVSLDDTLEELGYINEETDPTVPAHVKGITSNQIFNWDEAHGWSNHSGLYDPLNTASGLISTHNGTYDHTLISTALQDITGESVFDLSDFPAIESPLQFLRVASNGIDLEFHTLTHSNLETATLNSDTDYVHLSLAQKNKITQPATIELDGYMTKEQVGMLDAALTEFTVDANALGAELVFVDNVLKLDDDIAPLDDDATDDSHVLSAEKIYSLLEGDTEVGSYAKSYPITLGGGADLTTKLGTQTKPTGWTLSADGANLQITHSLGTTPIGIAVYRITSGGSKQKLEGNTAYSNATSSTEDTILTLSAYAATEDATEIRLSF